MSIFNFFGKKKEPDPDKHNAKLYKKFYRDMKRHSFPEFPPPTQKEITEYTQRRYRTYSTINPLFNSAVMERLQVNYSIPLEVNIWVDKVMDYYFSTYIYRFGWANWDSKPRKALYEYKGYTWYSAPELYPTVTFD